MHELFLTAVVPDAELERAKALLQGLSGMTAYAGLHRVLYFAGPPANPRGLAVKRSIPTPMAPAQARLWSELHQQLSRQSFVVQARYPVQQSDFGATPSAGDAAALSLSDDTAAATAAATLARINGTPGTLRWMDIPDPTGAVIGGASHRLVTQRKRVDIGDARNLPAILHDNNYRFKSELVEESFSFFTGGNEYALVRHHRLPPSSPAPATAPPGAVTPPLAALPPWEEVVNPLSPTSVDPAGQWLFFVRRHVLEDTSPEKMAKALEELEAARAQLAGAFVFRPVDRRAHDTRIERPPNNNMPAPLPQKVRA